MSLIDINREQTTNPYIKLTDSEAVILQKALRQLNWVAGMSRPEVSFKVSETSTSTKNATVSDLISLNKIIKYLKTTSSYIKYPMLDVNSLKILVFSNVSFINLKDGGSQDEHIIFLREKIKAQLLYCGAHPR